MTASLNFTATDDDADTRLDVFLAARLSGLTRSGIKRLVDDGLATINGKPGKPGNKLRSSDAITVEVPQPSSAAPLPENLPFEILFEDADILVINKPAGMAVHPGAGRSSGTLVNALLFYTKDYKQGLPRGSGDDRPGIVHRIDKDTSGVLVVAKNDEAHAALAAQFKSHTTVRRYLALVGGVMRDNDGTIDLPLGRDSSHRKKISARTRKARSAVTQYKVLKRYQGLTLLELTLKTGRTHQVRAHLSAIHHPIAGDPVYGGKLPSAGVAKKAAAALKTIHRQLLHAATLGLIHPRTGLYIEWSVSAPDDMARVMKALDEDNP